MRCGQLCAVGTLCNHGWGLQVGFAEVFDKTWSGQHIVAAATDLQPFRKVADVGQRSAIPQPSPQGWEVIEVCGGLKGREWPQKNGNLFSYSFPTKGQTHGISWYFGLVGEPIPPVKVRGWIKPVPGSSF